jgi:hypothetical protein
MVKENEIDYITAYERGELRGNKVLELFSYLMTTGKIGNLQRGYRLFSGALILRGYLSATGEILKMEV